MKEQKINSATFFKAVGGVLATLLVIFIFQFCEKIEPISLLLVSTDTIHDISINYITISGSIVHLGEKQVEEHGFCWAEGSGPVDTLETSTQLGSSSSPGSFSDSITSLQPNTKYYIRAYASDASGTKYGKELSFTTKQISSPTVTTIPVTGITLENALSGGEIVFSGGSDITAKGVCWNTKGNPSVLDTYTNEGRGKDDFVSIINRLACGTTYYVRAYASNSIGTGYGEELTFRTLDCPVGLPVVMTSPATAISETHAQAGGEVTDEGNSTVTARGLCWSTNRYPVLSDFNSFAGGGSGSFTSNMTELNCGTWYYFRAYATNEAGTSYGQLDSLQTSPCPIYVPTLNTAAVTEITQTSARGGGEVIEDGGSTVVAKGVCWSTDAEPDLDDHFTVNGAGTGSYVSQLTGLQCGTRYYIRAYATNDAGTGFGPALEFTTEDCVYQDPTVTTSVPTDITQTSIQAGGNVTDDGGAEIIAKGVCWATHQNPSLLDSYTNEGPGSGVYTSSVTGLGCGTTYYLKAYSTNSAGTSYGAQIEVTTNLCLSTPTVHTSAITEITEQSALCGGEVTDNGNLQITARGICWSDNPTPTINENKSENGIGMGTFTHLILGLTPSTTYYVRAYAENDEGIAYGEEETFTTWQGSVTDYDGNRYPTVQIGNQVWMASNLKVSHFPDGTPIPYVPGYDEWKDLIYDDKAYCYYKSDTMNLEVYGAMYTWSAAANGNMGSDANPSGVQGVCPDGWHLPSNTEWQELELVLGMDPDDAYYEAHNRGANEGGMLKESGTEHWEEPNTGATNETGFTVLPAGQRDGSALYSGLGSVAVFWNADAFPDGSQASIRSFRSDYGGIDWVHEWKYFAVSVRCVKDD